MSKEIPQPPGWPIIGNFLDVDPEHTLESFWDLHNRYGEICRIMMMGVPRYVVSSHALFTELCDERRFQKAVTGPINQLRVVARNGLLTAYPGDPEWDIAHRTMLPFFGPLSIKERFEEMRYVTNQLIEKWARFGSDHEFDAPGDFNRLAFDALGLCLMDTKMNCFYEPQTHEFVTRRIKTFQEVNIRAFRPKFMRNLMWYLPRGMRLDRNINYGRDFAEKFVEARLRRKEPKNDLLDLMLNGRDPKTGQKLSHDSVINNILTSLVAGQDTIAVALSFLMYHFIEDQTKFDIAQHEVDEIIGDRAPEYDDMAKLPYVTACVREVLRLWPSAPIISLQPLDKERPTVIGGGKYEIPPGGIIFCALPCVHRDPAVWGEDADKFNPERMLDENMEKLPKDAWRPFGNGVRSCAGRNFALQQMMLATIMILQHFRLEYAKPGYQLQLDNLITISPRDLKIRVTLREGLDLLSLEKKLHSNIHPQKEVVQHQAETHTGDKLQPLNIFYASNAGTSRALSSNLATQAFMHGFDAKIAVLDTATENMKFDTPVIIITSTYDGGPAHDAVKFVEWLESLKSSQGALDGLQFAVFGCGHRDWAATLHSVPRKIDQMLEEHGGRRIANIGLVDAASGNIIDKFDSWLDEELWPGLSSRYNMEISPVVSGFSIDIDVPTDGEYLPSAFQHDGTKATVNTNRLLTPPGHPKKRHMDLDLGPDYTFKPGDYLAILPINSRGLVDRVLQHFHISLNAMITVKTGTHHYIPAGERIPVLKVLNLGVDLNCSVSSKNIQAVQNAISNELRRKELSDLEIETARHISLIDLLERFPEADISLSQFLTMCPPLQERQYSISSSPLRSTSHASITWSVVSEDLEDGKKFLDTTSNYLATLSPGDQVQVTVQSNASSFHLPGNNTPLIMVCMGSGIAPFRAFIQERAILISRGCKVAPALLFVGCRSISADTLYEDEFKEWSTMGAVDVRYAFSRTPEASCGARYVQERIWRDRADVVKMYQAGARVYLCASKDAVDGLAKTAVEIFREEMSNVGDARAKGIGGEDLCGKWLEKFKRERVSSDLFLHTL